MTNDPVLIAYAARRGRNGRVRYNASDEPIRTMPAKD